MNRAAIHSTMALVLALTSVLADTEVLLTMEGGAPRKVILVAGSDVGIEMRLPETPQGTMLITFDRVQEIQFLPPPDWAEASRRRMPKEMQQALPSLRRMAERVQPYLLAPKTDAADYYFAYPAMLLRLGLHQQALEFLQKTPDESLGGTAATHAILTAYCLAAQGRHADADSALLFVRAPARTDPLFNLYFITLGLIAEGRRDFVAAVDNFARVAATSGIGSEHYAEAQFRLAGAYEQLAQAVAGQRKALQADPLLANIANTNLEEAIRLSRYSGADSATMAALVNAPAGSLDAVPHTIRRFVLRLWGESDWGLEAGKKLPPGQLPEDDRAVAPVPAPVQAPGPGAEPAAQPGTDPELDAPPMPAQPPPHQPVQPVKPLPL